MANTVIEIEQLSKKFRIGTIGSGSFRQDLHLWWKNSLKKNLSYSPEIYQNSKNLPGHIWALKCLNFKVKEGEVVGIIGNNGSGKSTLLKIISRIIQPTQGIVRGKGKVSSILEIGTGFHPELTGRENIYNSGYTLGMNKNEVNKKFDEIVSFSGVEKFIDTPVKRYSSGMYVRLAFSVAAHLEPDILIVDEVLAVGDADFQVKSMGRMKEVSNSNGRTILFVSHNLQAINNLCTKALWLDDGILKNIGKPSEIISEYISFNKKDDEQNWNSPDAAPGNEIIRLKSASVKPGKGSPDNYISVRTTIELNFEFWSLEDNLRLNINIRLLTINNECVFDLGSPSIDVKKGVMVLNAVIPAHLLNDKNYSVSLAVIKNGNANIFEFINCLNFDVEDVREGMTYFGVWPGIVRPKIDSILYMA